MIELQKEVRDEITAEELEQHILAVREERHQLRKLGEHAGWVAFEELVLVNAKNFRGSLEGGAITSLEHALKENYNRGIATGLERAIMLRREILEAYDMTLAQFEAFLKEKQNARGTAEPDADNGADEPELPLANGHDDTGAGADKFAP